MADDLKKVGLVFKADGTTDFVKSLTQINSLSKENYSNFKLLQSQYDKNTSSVTKLKNEQGYLQNQTQTYSSKVALLEKELQEMEQDENASATAIAKKKTQLNQAQTTLNNYQSRLDEVNNALKTGAAQLKEYSEKLESVSTKAKNVGQAMSTAITAPIAAAGAAALKATSDFDTAMSQVQSISGATGKDLESLKDKAKEMGATTKFSATESAEAMNYMAMAGWKTSDMLDGIEGIMNLAAASGEDLATVSDILTDDLTAFGASASESNHFADVFAKTAASANTNVSLLGESFKQVGPLAGSMGYSIEDMSIALGLMGNASIKAGTAGTNLRNIISRMAAPTDAVESSMERLGVSLTDEKGNVKSFDELIQNLRTSFASLSDAEKTREAAILAGKGNMAGLLTIVNATDADYQKLKDSIYNASGAAEEMANIQLDNLEGDTTLFQSALEGVGIKIGNVIMPLVREIVQIATSFLEVLNSLDDKTTTIITTIAGVVAAIGPLLLIVGSLGIKISEIMAWLSEVMIASAEAGGVLATLGETITAIGAGPIVAIIAAIALLVATIMDLWNTNETFRDDIINIVNVIASTLENIWSSIIQPVLEKIIEIVKNIWNNSVLPLYENLKTFITTIVTLVSTLFTAISPILNAIINILGTIIPPIVEYLGGIVQKACTIISAAFSAVLIVASTICTGITVYIKALSAVIQAVATIIANVFKTVQDKLKTAYNAIKNVVNSIKTTVSSAFNSIKTIASNVWNSVYNAIKGPLDKAKSYIKTAIDAIKGFFNFKFSWPNLTLPHFSITPSGWSAGDLLKGKIPKLGIKWYAAAMDKGMILDSPTIFGIGKDGKMLGGGEAGNEVVVGQNSLKTMIEDAVANNNAQILATLLNILEALQKLDIKKEIIQAIDEAGFTLEIDGRGFARLVRKYA